MKTREQILERIKSLEKWYNEDRALAIKYQKEGAYDMRDIYTDSMVSYNRQIKLLKWVLDEDL